jgi:ABC-2 type transport system ATP-binding protein
MRQKVILAQALLHDPLLYLIDEPLVGLDPKSSKDVKLIIRRERDRGKTFLISTHLLGLTDEIADRVGIIDQGRLRFVGTIKELKEQAGEQDLEEVYLKMTRQGDTGTGSPAATT